MYSLFFTCVMTIICSLHSMTHEWVDNFSKVTSVQEKKKIADAIDAEDLKRYVQQLEKERESFLIPRIYQSLGIYFAIGSTFAVATASCLFNPDQCETNFTTASSVSGALLLWEAAKQFYCWSRDTQFQARQYACEEIKNLHNKRA